VSDIHDAQTAPGLKGALLRMLDRFICRRASLLTVTAEKFHSVYYREWIGARTPAVVLENKLEEGFVDSLSMSARVATPDGTPLVDRPMRIGYFGLLRCPWAWDVLRDLARNHGERIEIVLAGRAVEPSDLAEQVKAFPSMRYLGEYKSPQDLEKLYTQVDIVWACYPPMGPRDWNFRWARPNRFYESCCFFRPLLSREGSCDSADVRRFGIGLCIDDVDPHAAAVRIAAITAEDLRRWREAMMEVPRSVYAYSDEVARLGEALRGMSPTVPR
jgi:succinoglycan biosynthesis protein ExoL